MKKDYEKIFVKLHNQLRKDPKVKVMDAVKVFRLLTRTVDRHIARLKIYLALSITVNIILGVASVAFN